MESGLLVELQLARDAEAVHRVDVAGVVAGRDEAALVRELADRVHPDAVLPAPVRFLRARPAEEVRAVVRRRRLEILLERRVQILAEPGQILRPGEIAAGLVDREGRVPRN